MPKKILHGIDVSDKENKTKKTIFLNNITTGYHRDLIFEISGKYHDY